MTSNSKKPRATGYDRYIDWRLFAIPLGLFIIILTVPTPTSMLQVGAEFTLGPHLIEEHFAQEVFGREFAELNQWRAQVVLMMRASVDSSSFSHLGFLKRDLRWCERKEIKATAAGLEQALETVRSIQPEHFEAILRSGYDLKTGGLDLHLLGAADRARVEKAGFQVKVAVATVAFVVGCFLTEANPLPMVAFCICIIAMLT